MISSKNKCIKGREGNINQLINLHKVGIVALAVLLSGVFVAPSASTAHYGVDHSISDMPEGGVGGPSQAELKARKEQLEAQLKADEAAKKQKQDEQAKLAKQMKELDGQITGIEQKVRLTASDITTNQQAIDEKLSEIAQKEADLAKQREQQNETLRVLYENGNPSTLELLVGSDSLSEFLSYQQYLDTLEENIQQIIAEIERIKGELEVRKAELEKRRVELADLQSQQQQYKKALASQRVEKDRLLVNAKVAEQRIAGQIEEAKQVYADVNSELAKLEEAARRKAQQRTAPPKGTAGIDFSLPMEYRYISCEFGCQTPFQKFHTGVDFVNYAGTPITAAADGVVTTVARTSYGYGNHVVVTHNERFATIYAHMQDFGNVSVGKSVSRGDILGYEGTTGWSTGPHLHFELREYGVPIDPFDYI